MTPATVLLQEILADGGSARLADDGKLMIRADARFHEGIRAYRSELRMLLVTRVYLDIETRSATPIEEGLDNYVADPTCRVLCAHTAVRVGLLSKLEKPQLWLPTMPPPEAIVECARNPNWYLVCHNDAFERTFSQFLFDQHNWPQVPVSRRRCTMNKAHACAMPGNLGKLVEVLGLDKG
jgi:hypothetical protein